MIKNLTRPSMLSLKIVNNLFINKKGITIKDISNNLKIDYKNIHDTTIELFKKGIIKKEKIGNYNICKLNYSNEDIIEYLKEYNFYFKLKEFRKKYPTEYRIIIETCQQVINQNMTVPFFIFIVFGSYARNEEKKNSDIDSLFLGAIPESKAFKTILNKNSISCQKRFHIIEQHVNSFLKDLKNKDKLSIATEIYKEPPIVFYGDDIFFKIMVGANK